MLPMNLEWIALQKKEEQKRGLLLISIMMTNHIYLLAFLNRNLF